MNAAFDLRNIMGLEQSSQEKVISSPEKVATGKPRYVKLAQDYDDLAEMRQNLKDQAERIRVSERLRIEITKGLKSGADLTDILLTALECIGSMTGDKLFYDQNARVLKQREQ